MRITKAMQALSAAQQPPGPENYLCQQCKLFEGCKSPFLRAYAYKPSQKQVLFVGTQPTIHDAIQRMQFDSPIGRFFRQQVLKPIGLKPSQCVFVSAVACAHEKSPTANQVEQCRAFVQQVIVEQLPVKIVMLGAEAARSLLKLKEPVLKMLTCKIHRVYVINPEGEWIDIPAIVTYSMNYLLKNMGMLDVIRGHIQRFINEQMEEMVWPSMELL